MRVLNEKINGYWVGNGDHGPRRFEDAPELEGAREHHGGWYSPDVRALVEYAQRLEDRLAAVRREYGCGDEGAVCASR